MSAFIVDQLPLNLVETRRSIKKEWSAWGKPSSAFRNPDVGAPSTWGHWAAWGNRLRAYAWHTPGTDAKR